MMRSQRGSRLGSSILAAAAVLLVPSATTVRAQPGFGPDPFWPYNNQYTPYTSPIGPASPEGGQGGMTLNARDGLRGANQFQNYLETLQGPGRNFSDRSNIGMPYYRSAVDPTYETRGGGTRQYLPNARSAERLEETQRKAADMYFRYYGEKDPTRRGELLREYREARRESSLALSGRGRASDLPARAGSSSRREARAGATARRGSAAERTRTPGQNLGPAPEVPAIGSRRSSATTTRPRRSLPSDVLDRSQAMDRFDGLRPTPAAPGSPSRPRSGSVARPTTPPPTSGGDRP